MLATSLKKNEPTNVAVNTTSTASLGSLSITIFPARTYIQSQIPMSALGKQAELSISTSTEPSPPNMEPTDIAISETFATLAILTNCVYGIRNGPVSGWTTDSCPESQLRPAWIDLPSVGSQKGTAYGSTHRLNQGTLSTGIEEAALRRTGFSAAQKFTTAMSTSSSYTDPNYSVYAATYPPTRTSPLSNGTPTPTRRVFCPGRCGCGERVCIKNGAFCAEMEGLEDDCLDADKGQSTDTSGNQQRTSYEVQRVPQTSGKSRVVGGIVGGTIGFALLSGAMGALLYKLRRRRVDRQRYHDASDEVMGPVTDPELGEPKRVIPGNSLLTLSPPAYG